MEQLIVRYINILSDSMRQSMQKFKEEAGGSELFNLTITQLHYIHAIHELKGPTLTDLVERFNVQKSTVTAAVNRLVERKYAYKVQSEQDLRVYHIYLSGQGQQMLDLENKGYYNFACKMTECLTDSETQVLTQLLNKVIQGVGNS
ncbi:MAG: transcriptional regulator, MarR family [Firmicutes bacterium]|nr:transcriptional regulator, MarR family [Bacillota bacterium]